MMKKNLYLFLFILSPAAFALETDQFITANVELKDSLVVMNDYFHQGLGHALTEANKRNLSCDDVAFKVMETATGKWSISKASTFASVSPLIERYPDDSISERGYKDRSFYQHAWLPLQVVDLARTINVNGIYMGTDKFGHFTRMGMNYYKTYLKLKKNGTPIDIAIEQAIIKGFGSEYGILGYGIGGVLSYGDLEANYQGFMAALDMCRGESPILIQEKNLWIENPNHVFDLSNYVNPKMDESFNISFWRKPLYNRIAVKLRSEYCQANNTKLFKERMSYYRQIVKYNLNDLLIKNNILVQSKYDRKLENLETSCESELGSNDPQ
jgi:hypothetical protein